MVFVCDKNLRCLWPQRCHHNSFCVVFVNENGTSVWTPPVPVRLERGDRGRLGIGHDVLRRSGRDGHPIQSRDRTGEGQGFQHHHVGVSRRQLPHRDRDEVHVRGDGFRQQQSVPRLRNALHAGRGFFGTGLGLQDVPHGGSVRSAHMLHVLRNYPRLFINSKINFVVLFLQKDGVFKNVLVIQHDRVFKSYSDAYFDIECSYDHYEKETTVKGKAFIQE